MGRTSVSVSHLCNGEETVSSIKIHLYSDVTKVSCIVGGASNCLYENYNGQNVESFYIIF